MRTRRVQEKKLVKRFKYTDQHGNLRYEFDLVTPTVASRRLQAGWTKATAEEQQKEEKLRASDPPPKRRRFGK